MTPLPSELLWDQHACLPLQLGTDVDPLARFRRPGGTFVSVNAGYSPHSFSDTVALLRYFRSAVAAHPDMELADGIEDVASITGAGRIAVVFDLEDANPIEDNLDNVAALADLGVRTLLPTYNHANRAGSGCLDADDGGLTSWGRSVVAELNRVGIVPDGSHCSARTGLDLCEISSGPVIYSHSCMRAVWDHPRNITDDQARACAATGGVVGITGVGIFLGPNTPTLDAMMRHLDYAVDLVGIDHVGISSDFSFDYADFVDELTRNPQLFDESYTRWGPIQWMPPETLLTIGEYLGARGWTDDNIRAVAGGNFYRVAQQAWRGPGDRKSERN
ncbi:membrane dipeptidase [Mycobacterium intermedium]|uniref:Membrane dipeptidase n=1 Tax=Mycobacterium intermedium TaxID=28445 RepID=A0A1E3SEC4_MYCIE|nr:membrane dipeptidase [Mycobacterium intermedium]MCV6966568.1 membrane dipeptidase [Mycobacterium intermedium]ODQ99917.1 membrane dipeptidase [Mycobacterium intermedium]OPE49807.1 membrane dipeptidase [Mycobacterium intermedium]ORB08274.1 membrane dipeptidase [Mycobacterium intermedium]